MGIFVRRVRVTLPFLQIGETVRVRVLVQNICIGDRQIRTGPTIR